MNQPYPPAPPQEENLRLLSIFHYVLGGLMAVMSCIPLIHLTIGLVLLFGPGMDEGGLHNAEHMGRTIGILFAVLGGAFFLVGETVSILVIKAGRNIARRKGYTFVFVMACVQCLFVPLGTVLGVFTLVTLNKPEVQALFPDKQARMA